VRPNNSFRVATINTLGASHTDRPGGNAFGRWLKSVLRIVLLCRVILFRRLDLVGLQEFQPVQQARLRKILGRRFAVYAVRDNAIIYRKNRWTRVDSGHLDIPYFGGHEKPMPWLILRHRDTGKHVAVLCTHNPASTRGDAAAWRREGWRREIAWAKNMLEQRRAVAALVVGDKNAGPAKYRPVVHKNNGIVAGTPTIRGIDWIVAWGGISFSRFKTARTKRISRATDHPVVQAVAHI